MSDYLVRLGQSDAARQVVSALGLPLPLPEELARDGSPWRSYELEGRRYVIGGAKGDLGGRLTLSGATWRHEEGEASESREKYEGLLYDARGIEGAAGLRGLYDFFHSRIRGLVRCGRVLILSDLVDDAKTAAAAAGAAGVEGFVRSVSKELGRKGATANLLRVGQGAEAHIDAPLRFLMSMRSAFVTGQALTVTAELQASPVWQQPLAGKVALVTGAARGIGAATAKRLAAEGARVVCLDRPGDEAALEAVVDECGGVALFQDVSAADAAATIADFLLETTGGVDVVIHNAGVTRDRTLARMSSEEWELALGINLDAVSHIQDALIEKDCLHKGGRVVCLSSIAGIAGNVGQTNYAASKAALLGYIRYQAPVLAKRGIGIAAVAPGFIETQMTAAIPFMTREGARRLSNLGQGGLPEDVAELLTFLSSPGAAGLTGQCVRVCGGSLVGA